MKPEFMRLRRALAGSAAALLMTAGLVVLSPALSASAHDYDGRADCATGLSVNLTSYPRDTTVEVVIDEAIRTDTTFGGSWSNSYTWDGNVDHEYTVTVDSPDDPTGSENWSFSETKTVTACTPVAPTANLTVEPCTGATTTATLNLKRLVVGSNYVITIVSGEDQPAGTLPLRATTTNHSAPLHDFGPGEYYVAVSTVGGAVLTRTAPVTTGCATPLTVTAQLEPCTVSASGTDREISIEADGLAASTVHTIRLVTADAAATVVASTTTAGASVTSFSHTFTGVPSPGDYKIEVLDGADILETVTITSPLCDSGAADPDPDGPLDTLAPPSIELRSTQCDGVDSTKGAVSASMIDLDATKTYYVRIVDGSGGAVAGGEDQTVSGSTTATVNFPGITAPGTYTAQLLINPGKQLAATSPDSVDLTVCLPTLAMTGPGVLVPLGSVAALLLTLGGAVVTGRLRRRMAL